MKIEEIKKLNATETYFYAKSDFLKNLEDANYFKQRKEIDDHIEHLKGYLVILFCCYQIDFDFIQREFIELESL